MDPFRTGTGWTALALVFIASATGTAAYFSDAEGAGAPSQTAAAAEANPFTGIKLEGESAYVYDLAAHRVLYSLDPDVQLPLASLTKIATVLAVSQVLPPDAVIAIPYDTAPPGAPARLAAGQHWRARDVINFTLVISSNEGADILAAAAEGDIRARYPDAPAKNATVWRMNQIARELGLARTYFLNDNGLDASATQSGAYGSARDVAALLSYAATEAPSTFAATTQPALKLRPADGATILAVNTDEALDAVPGLIMGKTGYTDLAGGNLAIAFDVGPSHPIVAVVLHSTWQGRFDDMKKIVAAAQAVVAEGL